MNRKLLSFIIACACMLASVYSVSGEEFNFVKKGEKYFLVLLDAQGLPTGSREVKVRFHVFIDGDVIPDPTPDPTPTPPTPIVPQGFLGLTKAVHDVTLANTTQPERAKGKLLADNFHAVAAQLAAGGYANITAANADLKAKNQTSLPGASRDAWLAAMTEQSKLVAKHFADGHLSTADEQAKAYHAVADGFELAAKIP